MIWMTSIDATPLPALPAELERLIFEVAATSWPRSILRFMLVAWRVKIWVEPLLYRTIIVADHRPDLRPKFRKDSGPFAIESSTLNSLIHSKPPSFFKYSVRQLYLSQLDPETEAVVLDACSNVENFWLSAQTSATVLRLNMPLKRLHCSLKALFGPDQIDFSRLFTSITHLEIFDVPTNIEDEVWSALTRLPHLTHLAFNNDDYLPLCLTLLQTWEALQALVVLVYDRDGGLPEVDDDLAQHPRFVLMVCQWYLEDWMRGAHTGDDYWSRADNFIAKRKSGEINPLEYFLDPEDEVDSEDD
ncbi:hypothetical protein B0H19DRAFT_1124825 [Mycena capillaripes]|nr:hypothetical protein B0H19DRAFT_1124825 [Mycena capillaripes]